MEKAVAAQIKITQVWQSHYCQLITYLPHSIPSLPRSKGKPGTVKD